MEFRGKAVTVNENEFLIVPKGGEHKPVADEEVWIRLFETAYRVNSRNVINESQG